ncbi:MAG: dihydrolipoyl dehydrogenase [Alphaproteobacteria bacterium]|nr:dihydrolipoyl dehydrogenase [Alphaproteobacteria bacterium]
MADAYDVLVLGGGPGGYNAAIRAAQLGKKTACIEARATLGGTCLNVGCIPSKALLHASHLFDEAQHFATMGVKAKGGIELDLPAMMAHKEKTVGELTRGVEFLFRKHRIDWIKGFGRFVSPLAIEVKAADGTTSTVQGKDIIIATGSEVMTLPGVTIDEKQIVSSTGALALKAVPKRMLVIGGGYIGLEMGSVWRRLGSAVTVVEYLDRITPGMDGEISKQFQRILQKQGMTFKLGMKVVGADMKAGAVQVRIEPAQGGEQEMIEADVVLVSIGRRPFTAGIGLETIGVKLDPRGRVISDAHFATGVPNVWAIGDVREGPMLAHKAEDEAVAVAELIAGQAGHVNYDAIPGVVYTAPEVATVGKTEEELKAAGIPYKAGKFPFTANARAKTIAATEGFAKILADAKSDRILGAHIIGAEAGNMIAELALAIEFGAASEDIARTSHAHPTLPEAVRQAAMAIGGWTMQM